MGKAKFLKTLTAGICLTALLTGTALADGGEEQDIKIQINGSWLHCDTAPFIENSHTLLPLRAVMEGLGAKVEWYSERETVKVYADDVNIELIIGEEKAKVVRRIEGTEKEEELNLEVAAKIVGGRTFIPGCFVSEVFSAEVQWDDRLGAMIIETGNMSDIPEIEKVIAEFGEKIKLVSLFAPQDVLNECLQETYGELVSPVLLEKWQRDKTNIPGRLTSSPWPERIEILTIEKISVGEYVVKGEIIEVTGTEQKRGGVAGRRPITFFVKKENDHWSINDANLGVYEEVKSVVYQNTQYGFNFYLPESWEGYKVIDGDKWEGAKETGPIIYIRHPLWTTENQRQDIPVMIFTAIQWSSLQQEEFNVGAAPIPPKELDRNDKYVFALPARYNYAFPTGYEEVEEILEGEPLQANNS